MALSADTAVLVVDMINPLDFDGADALFERALPASRALGVLLGRARASGVPTIFVNDAFHSGTSDLKGLVEHHRRLGGPTAALLAPLDVDPQTDAFVAKSRHSGFFQTPLEELLRKLGTGRLVVTGIAADICVLATAFDAHMRDFSLAIPCDCVAAESEERERWVLPHMERVFDADVRASRELALRALGSAA